MKTLTIAGATFREGIRQPFYLLVLAVVTGFIILHYWLPFFTFDYDILMYKDVCLAYMLIGLLVMALLLASKVVDEEIENKTTLTLMSKPVRRWELIAGKFVGVMAAATLALLVFGMILSLFTWLRVPNELHITPDTINERDFDELASARQMHMLSLLPAYVLMWLQIAVMASIAIAMSTRLGMVLTMVAGIAIFVVAHLMPFLAEGAADMAGWQRGLAEGLAVVLPNLETFNLNEMLIYKEIVTGVSVDELGRNQVAYGDVWRLVGWSGLYAGAYVAVALLLGLALFRTRELG